MALRKRMGAALSRVRMGLPPAAVAAPLTVRRSIPARLLDPLEQRVGLGVTCEPLPPPPQGRHRLLVGPTNYAAQGQAWAQAASRLPGVGASSFMVHNPFDFPVDAVVPPRVFAGSRWAREMERHVIDNFTEVLFEAARPVLGLRHGLDAAGDVRTLCRAGLRVAMVAHGTDVRDIAAHARRFTYSPYADPKPWRDIARLADNNRRLLRRLKDQGIPLFVSTPDLLVEFPDAQWLPVVVDPVLWQADTAPLTGERRPVVVHAPSVAAVKGTGDAHPQLESLAAEGLIDYRPLRGLSRADFCAGLREADIIVDQFGLGSYGVAAVEGMAAGRIVIARVDPIRETVRRELGREVPLVESAPEALGATIRRLLVEPDRGRAIAERGRAYAHDVHDGRRAASVLAPWLIGSAGSAGAP